MRRSDLGVILAVVMAVLGALVVIAAAAFANGSHAPRCACLDVNADGRVTAVDALIVLDESVGIDRCRGGIEDE